MMPRLAATSCLTLIAACSAPPGRPGPALDRSEPGELLGARAELPTISERTEGFERLDGFLPLYWDAQAARLLVEVPAPERDVLYYVSLASGLGSNDVGLDRGQIGARRLVRFHRAGRRVLLVAPNLDWRSSSASVEERSAVRESFADGVLWGFDVLAREGTRALIDATDFFLRDAHGIARKLEDRGQGEFQLEGSRSYVPQDGLASFPSNTEVEALLTFTSESPGPEVRRTAAAPESVSLGLRHSFVALAPLDEVAYRPRRFDPRSGYFSHEWNDLSAPIDEPVVQRVIRRHHLAADRPIVYYVDGAAPEPVRTALLEGARYWCPVFEAAGFPGGFRVELLPAGRGSAGRAAQRHPVGASIHARLELRRLGHRSAHG